MKPEPEVFDQPNNIFEAHIKDIFKQDTSEMDIILSLMSVLVSKNIRDKSILSLYKITDIQTFSRVLMLFEGRTVSFPSREEIEDLFILSICYYYREVEDFSWDKIKEIVPFEIQATTYGLKINALSNLIQKKMKEIIGV